MEATAEEVTVAEAATREIGERQGAAHWLEALLTWVYDLIGLPVRPADGPVDDIAWEDGEPEELTLPHADP